MDVRGSYVTHPDDLAKTAVFFPEPGHLKTEDKDMQASAD
jgi:hypothetical protein